MAGMMATLTTQVLAISWRIAPRAYGGRGPWRCHSSAFSRLPRASAESGCKRTTSRKQATVPSISPRRACATARLFQASTKSGAGAPLRQIRRLPGAAGPASLATARGCNGRPGARGPRRPRARGIAALEPGFRARTVRRPARHSTSTLSGSSARPRSRCSWASSGRLSRNRATPIPIWGGDQPGCKRTASRKCASASATSPGRKPSRSPRSMTSLA